MTKVYEIKRTPCYSPATDRWDIYQDGKRIVIAVSLQYANRRVEDLKARDKREG